MNYDPYRPEQQIPADGYKVEDMSAAPQPSVQKKKRLWPKVVALCLACTLVGSVGGAAVTGYFLLSLSGTPAVGDSANGGDHSTTIYESDREAPTVNVAQTNNGREYTLEEIYAAWVNSTVGISTEIVTTNYFGQQVSAAAGSGFVISEDGYIVTNYHVIEGASTIKVTFYDGTVYDAMLIGGEQSNDVAVLKIEAQGLTPVIIGDSDDLHVGQEVTAIGNPLGELTFSQTHGIVSAKDRSVTLDDGLTINMIQTDCTINSGNSGGPLFNTYGEVVGITSAKYSNNGSYSEATIEGIGFAIPMNDVVGLIKDIMEHGYVTGKPNVGILLGEVDDGALRYGIPDGASVEAVLSGSCADKAGLQEGDIITAVDGTSVTGISALQSAVKSYRAGDQVTFTVYREGRTLELRLTLDESTQERSDALDALYEEKYSQQSQQQTQTPSGGGYNYPDYGFGFGWPFGW